MMLFVTGGTGALGSPAVARFVRAGHRVRALATSESSAARLRAAGAEPVAGSVFDPAVMTAAVRGADAILHLATRIAPAAKARRRAAWIDNDRLRRDGTRVPAGAYQPLVWDEDVAEALLAAVETGTLTGGYDVADDHPLTRAELNRRNCRGQPRW